MNLRFDGMFLFPSVLIVVLMCVCVCVCVVCFWSDGLSDTQGARWNCSTRCLTSLRSPSPTVKYVLLLLVAVCVYLTCCLHSQSILFTSKPHRPHLLLKTLTSLRKVCCLAQPRYSSRLPLSHAHVLLSPPSLNCAMWVVTCRCRCFRFQDLHKMPF